MNDIVVGIDLGGTASRLLAYGSGEILASAVVSTATLGAGSVDTKLNRLAKAITDMVSPNARLVAVGVGASGPVDIQTGIIHNPHTLPSFSGFDLVTGLRQRLAVPVILENDAVAAAIAEQRVGAGTQAERLLVVTLGTGIGVALLVAGKPFRGPANSHPEAGHLPIPSSRDPCYCGLIGCWEQAASRKALQQRLRPLFAADITDADLLSTAAQDHENPDVQRAFYSFGTAVGEGLAILDTVYVPDITVIAGSAAAYLERFASPAEARLNQRDGFSRHAIIVPTSLGDNAGAIGAALMAASPIVIAGG